VEHERRAVHATTLVLMTVVVAFGAMTIAGLHPGAAVASALGLAAIVGIVSIAVVDRSPNPAATAGATLGDAPDLVRVVSLELERGRRQEHPFSVIRLPRSTVVGDLAEVRDQLRTIDELVVDGDSAYLVLPGADQAAAAGCIDRLIDACDLRLTDPPRRATFPDDGVTLTGLLAVLDGAPPAAGPEDLPTLDRRRRIVVDLTATTTPSPLPSDVRFVDEVDA
jgi:hypothetical protein